jgi:hypothetical protein
MPPLIKKIAGFFKDGWSRIIKRLSLWTNHGIGAFNDGILASKPPPGVEEKRYVWILGNTEEHCSDCLRLNGVVLTASEWGRAGIRPQSPDLECGGWHCDCRLEETERKSMGLGAV